MKERFVYFAIVIPIIIGVFLLQTYKVDPFESFSLRFNDINFELSDKEISKEIVFVAVDEPSVNEFGRWPWDRTILAKGIEKLSLAGVVVMDMIFSEPTSEVQDNILVKSIAGLNSSVCGFFLRHKATQTIDDEALDILSDSSLDALQTEVSEHTNPLFISAKNAEVNIMPILSACTLSGSFSTLSQEDYLLRSYPIAVYYADILYPSLAIQALRLRYDTDINRVDTREVTLNERVIGLDDKGFIRLNFYKKEKYDIVSFLDVAQEKVKPEYFKNKIVILGITEVGAGDIVSTPVGALAGALLHYTFLSNLLEDHLIEEPKQIGSVLLVFMGLLPLALILFMKNILTRSLVYIVSYTFLYIIVRYVFIQNHIYIDLFYPLLAILLSASVVEVVAFRREEKGGKFIRGAFSSYLSGELLNELIENPNALTLGGENKELSILFSDIRGFTSISESMDPVSLITLLNRYFTPMTDTVLAHKGMLDKYIGDAVMAFYNAPVNVKEHADAACYSALEMIIKLDKLNEELQLENIPPIRIGIGINTANVVVGNMGSDTRFNYTVIGDGVNLAARVEGLTKNYAVDILITEFTVEKLTKEFIYRKIEPVQVKGKDEAVLLYELMPTSAHSKEIKVLYDEALAIYIDGDFMMANKLFTSLVEIYEDGPSKYFLKSVKENIPWGIHKMTTK